jgi:hypothetical protein
MPEMVEAETIGCWRYFKLLLEETFADIKWARDMLIGGCVSIASLALQVWWALIARDDWHLHKWQWVASAILPTLAVIALNIAFRLIVAPWKVHQDQERKHSESMKQANDQIDSLQQQIAKFAEIRPRVVPTGYNKAEGRLQMGLYLRNSGYDALDVEVPPVSVGTSGYTLEFLGRLPQLGERTGIAFLEAWLNHATRPGLDGSQLHNVMCEAQLESVNFTIVYKDTDLQPKKTECVIERTNRERNGISVRATSAAGIPC